jgi:hypothetical protein
MKIENRWNSSTFGIYSVTSGATILTNLYYFSGITCLAGNGNLANGEEHLISFVSTGINGGGGSGTSGTSGTLEILTGVTISLSGYTTTSGDTYLRVVTSGITVNLHDATGNFREMKIKNISNGDVDIQLSGSTIDGITGTTLSTKKCLIIKDSSTNEWDIISLFDGII